MPAAAIIIEIHQRAVDLLVDFGRRPVEFGRVRLARVEEFGEGQRDDAPRALFKDEPAALTSQRVRQVRVDLIIGELYEIVIRVLSRRQLVTLAQVFEAEAAAEEAHGMQLFMRRRKVSGGGGGSLCFPLGLVPFLRRP